MFCVYKLFHKSGHLFGSQWWDQRSSKVNVAFLIKAVFNWVSKGIRVCSVGFALLRSVIAILASSGPTEQFLPLEYCRMVNLSPKISDFWSRHSILNVISEVFADLYNTKLRIYFVFVKPALELEFGRFLLYKCFLNHFPPQKSPAWDP